MISTLGINTGFALNRYTAPEQWVPLVADTLGLKRIQFTADLCNVSMPDPLVLKIGDKIRNLTEKHGITVESTFTSAFTRVNHFSHPDEDVRAYWVEWFKKFISLSVKLGAKTAGSHFGILTVPDLKDSKKRSERLQNNLDCWKEVADFGAKQGLEMLTWEPMSIPREYGETIAESRKLQDAINKSDLALPLLMCLDVDHGDLASPNPDDTDPYAWLETFASESPQVHLKQSLLEKGGHYPFTDQYNQQGKVLPQKVLDALEKGGAKEVAFYLELSFREREPFESTMIDDLQESIEFWKPFCTL